MGTLQGSWSARMLEIAAVFLILAAIVLFIRLYRPGLMSDDLSRLLLLVFGIIGLVALVLALLDVGRGPPGNVPPGHNGAPGNGPPAGIPPAR